MIYLSFIGNHDKLENRNSDFGAVISIFLRYKDDIDSVYLFVTPKKKSESTDYNAIALDNKSFIEKEKPGVKVTLVPVEMSNPVDFD
ncbi:hypothetical protein D9V86_09420 [Bacteroidetes/Chlorobi group bacterium ChocPot_Mid]|nr:MAG: hypothetical protein D9V86_09420 [Bacteroidetes/Chlorobi group bacterium ChocPot_Mid]